ncbi:hypothetical protein MRX96_035730 [Rhipicephalus microplus]
MRGGERDCRRFCVWNPAAVGILGVETEATAMLVVAVSSMVVAVVVAVPSKDGTRLVLRLTKRRRSVSRSSMRVRPIKTPQSPPQRSCNDESVAALIEDDERLALIDERREPCGDAAHACG